MIDKPKVRLSGGDLKNLYNFMDVYFGSPRTHRRTVAHVDPGVWHGWRNRMFTNEKGPY